MLSTEKLLVAIEKASDGIALLDKNGYYYYLNEAHCKIFGYDSPSELIGKSWKTIYSSDFAKKLEKEILPVVMSHGNWSGETIGLKKDSKSIKQYIYLTKVPDDGLLCVCRDQSKDINSSRLEYLMSNLGKGVLVEDEEHNVVLVNRQFCNIFNIPLKPSEMVGTNCLDALNKTLKIFKDPENAVGQIYNMTGKRLPVVGDEVILADGRILERDYVPIIVENDFKGQLWSYTDVTQNKQLQKSLVNAENQAIASEKSKSAFLSNMSHEIRTPMNAIIGFSEQLLLSPLSEQQSFFLKNITDAAKGLIGIINDILDMSKIEAGKMTIEKEIISIDEIKNSVENILKPKAEEKGLNMITEYDKAINKNLFADEVRVRQILINIIGNAIKFTNSGFVKLSINLLNDDSLIQKVQFVCEDTGIGISPEALVHIFEDFYQEEHIDNNHRANGSGLGLAITKNIVTLLGGEIAIQSEKGTGTKLTITIPFEHVKDEDVEKHFQKFEDSCILEGKRILIVEDNHLNRLLFKMMLNNMKVIVDEAENGLEAMGKMTNVTYDLVLMDIQMPIMDGPTALAAIKKNYGDKIPVIALTAAAFKSEVSHMLNLGFSDCITKPIDQNNLQHRLCQFFSYGSVKDKYYTAIHKKIIANINQMSGNDKAQFSKMLEYLLEEIEYALNAWKEAIDVNDWPKAKSVLHREKVMIKSIGIDGFDGLIKEIEDDTINKTEAELNLMFSQLQDLFLNLKSKFSKMVLES